MVAKFQAEADLQLKLPHTITSESDDWKDLDRPPSTLGDMGGQGADMSGLYCRF